MARSGDALAILRVTARGKYRELLRLQDVGDPGRNRTCNRQLRRLMLYPVELRDLNASRDPAAHI